MLAVMEPSSNSPDDPKSEFIVTGRTGRRNAMADILGPNASTSSGDLAERMESLCTADKDETESEDKEEHTNPECSGKPVNKREKKPKRKS